MDMDNLKDPDETPVRIVGIGVYSEILRLERLISLHLEGEGEVVTAPPTEDVWPNMPTIMLSAFTPDPVELYIEPKASKNKFKFKSSNWNF